MRRITVWVDCKDEDLEETLKKVKKALESAGEWFRIVCIDPVEWPKPPENQK
jgi:hypothetical protein